MEKFSPIRIILDNKLKTNVSSYLFKTANKSNTIFFYNQAEKTKILRFKKKKIRIIKSKLNSKKNFDLKIILKKLYNIGFRNTLVEGGNELTNDFIKNRLFNIFYLYKSPKKLSKIVEFKEFNGFNILNRNYKNRNKVNSNFGKDTITLYTR